MGSTSTSSSSGRGFGGSVAALRLAEKGYRVAVLEAGRRFAPDDFPTTSWDLRNFLWAPALGCTGIQRIYPAGQRPGAVGRRRRRRFARLREHALPAAGRRSTATRSGATSPTGGTSWRPFYDQAERMLGVSREPTTRPGHGVAGRWPRRSASADTFHYAPRWACFFGEPGRSRWRTRTSVVPGRPGPAACDCGECMTGCRHGAKNTLDTNYLHLAERAGRRGHAADARVTAVRPRSTAVARGAPIRTARLRRQRPAPPQPCSSTRAEQVVFAAGALGTQACCTACATTARCRGSRAGSAS